MYKEPTPILHKSFRPLVIVACIALLIMASLRFTLDTRAQVRPIYSSGASGLGQLLKRLQTTASVLHTGAHPDDEDSPLIARLARGDQARVAYLSLNRGEGGQNIIGPDLFEPLGIIRTEELLQARRLDGGDQMFTRTMDYGFSKSRAEAAAKWGEREVLGDMVRAIRMYRPLVIISRFSGTPADGHGQHQLAGSLTPIAFKAAADPTQFPEQIAEGLRPWQAKKLYAGLGFGQNPNVTNALRIETGTYDPLIGRSYFEISMEGRSQHKSQEMGVLELRGPNTSGIRLVESNVKSDANEQSVFDGIDTSIKGIAAIAGLRDNIIADELSAMSDAAARALAGFDALAPNKIIAPLADGLKATRAARAKLTKGADATARADADFLLSFKEAEFSEALQRAAEIVVDALASAEIIVPGETMNVAVKVFAPPTSAVEPAGIRLRAPAGWTVEKVPEPAPQPNTGFRPSRETAQQSGFFKVAVPDSARFTQPYWLAEHRDGYMFKWPTDAAKNLPFDPPLVTALVTFEIGAVPVTIAKNVQYRYADDIRGELRREVNVVPAITVALDSNLIIAPLSARPQTHQIAVTVGNNAQHAMKGQIRLRLPDNWTSSPVSSEFSLATKGEHATGFFDITIPAQARVGSYDIGAVANADGKSFDQTMHTIAYPHIQTHRFYSRAAATTRVFALKVAPVNVGYIMGSGDEVPESIKRMGLDVTMLDENELSRGDLSRFDTIVLGVYATKVRPDLIANNNRLLDYVRNGGTLIVQYQRPDYLAANLAPFPAKMASRVTDETAKVTILQPEHPAFNFPNKITDEDFANWVQERSLYNFTTFDPRYTPLLESHDPGEDPQPGGELYAEIGRGKFVYTSYAWFRQLPSGVPGAYRLFANLLSLSKKADAVNLKPAR